MLNVKFTSEQRTALKIEIAQRLKARPDALPGFQSHTATKAQLIEAAQKLEIDVMDYGTAGGDPTCRNVLPLPPCGLLPRRSRCWTAGAQTVVLMRRQTS